MTEAIVTPQRRERVWPWVMGSIVVIAGFLAFMVPLPRYLESPGSTRNTSDLASIAGHESYDSDGEIIYLTVSQARATPATLIRAWLDSNIEVLTQEQVSPSGDRKADRIVDQARMDRSKLTALVVAFKVLGLPLTIDGDGAFIQMVESSAPAADVLEAGDIIVAVDGTTITNAAGLRAQVGQRSPGESVQVGVRRGDETFDAVVELIPAEEEPERGILGIVIQTSNETVDTGFDIELDSGSVIGPSAGLAWTLGVIDRLTPGDLTGGKIVAVTGTIDGAGNVGEVGGIEKKVVAAIRDGATLFLYPEGTREEDLEKTKKAADGKIEMRPVASIYDALDLLNTDGFEIVRP